MSETNSRLGTKPGPAKKLFRLFAPLCLAAAALSCTSFEGLGNSGTRAGVFVLAEVDSSAFQGWPLTRFEEERRLGRLREIAVEIDPRSTFEWTTDGKIAATLVGMDMEDAEKLLGMFQPVNFHWVADADDFRPILIRIDDLLARRPGGAAGGARPFTALLSAVGRDIGVDADNEERVEEILRDPEVVRMIPERFWFSWARNQEELADGRIVRRLYLLRRAAAIPGIAVSQARYGYGSVGGAGHPGYEVSVAFEPRLALAVERVLREGSGGQLALVHDFRVSIAPVVQGTGPDGRLSITGIGDEDEARALSRALRISAYFLPLTILEARPVEVEVSAEPAEGKWLPAVKWLMALFLGGIVLVLLVMLLLDRIFRKRA